MTAVPRRAVPVLTGIAHVLQIVVVAASILILIIKPMVLAHINVHMYDSKTEFHKLWCSGKFGRIEDMLSETGLEVGRIN